MPSLYLFTNHNTDLLIYHIPRCQIKLSKALLTSCHSPFPKENDPPFLYLISIQQMMFKHLGNEVQILVCQICKAFYIISPNCTSNFIDYCSTTETPWISLTVLFALSRVYVFLLPYVFVPFPIYLPLLSVKAYVKYYLFFQPFYNPELVMYN